MHLTEYNLRIAELKTFSKLYNEYISSKDHDLRNSVSSMSRKISVYVEDADVGVYLNDKNKGMYHIFENIVNGNLVTKEMVNDRIYSAIGVYEHRYTQLKRKLINPLAWAGEIIRIPFRIMKHAGLNAVKIESLFFSKLYKFIMAILVFISTVLVILNYLGVSTNIQTKQTIGAANSSIVFNVIGISGFKNTTIKYAPAADASKKHINPLTSSSTLTILYAAPFHSALHKMAS